MFCMYTWTQPVYSTYSQFPWRLIKGILVCKTSLSEVDKAGCGEKTLNITSLYIATSWSLTAIHFLSLSLLHWALPALMCFRMHCFPLCWNYVSKCSIFPFTPVSFLSRLHLTSNFKSVVYLADSDLSIKMQSTHIVYQSYYMLNVMILTLMHY